MGMNTSKLSKFVSDETTQTNFRVKMIACVWLLKCTALQTREKAIGAGVGVAFKYTTNG